MASISHNADRKQCRIQWVAADGSRKCLTISQGRNEKEAGLLKRANSLVLNLERLIERRTSGQSVDASLRAWIESLKPSHRKTLASCGLVDQGATEQKPRTLGPFLKQWMADRQSQKNSTLLVWGHAKRNLLKFFGGDKLLSDITEADAARF